MKKSSNNFIKFITIVLLVAIALIITPYIYCASYYVHEGGHIFFGAIGNKIETGNIGNFAISEWLETPFCKVPQQTKTDGPNTNYFRYGGMALIIITTFAIAYILYIFSKNKKFFTIPIPFIIYEFLGNFLCGTDNWNQNPLLNCNLINEIGYFFIFGLSAVIVFILYPYMKKILSNKSSF